MAICCSLDKDLTTAHTGVMAECYSYHIKRYKMHACCLFYVISIKPWGVPTAKGVGGKRESHTGEKKNKNRERKSEREAP